MTTEALVHSDIESRPVDVPRPAAPWSARYIHDVRDPFDRNSLAETLDTVVGLARETFGADGAAILLAAHGGAVPTAAAGARARRADTLQVDHHQGPGLSTIRGRQPVVSDELRFDSRWRFWAPQAADLGFRSVLSLALTDGEPFGAITLYSRRPSFFGTDSLAPGLLFAEQASIAITTAVEREQLLRAADARGIIGQAQGILMERYHISADQAFTVIRRSASAFNQRLRSIAERIIGGRSLSDIDVIALHHVAGATSLGSGFDQ
ncbi:MAG TPA: GAF and ANTAR domain-containing protein [Propionibacteriaceae bacterium]|nr:GAF and ANTAR domain-containing protein [Propionibacteriaceae bacterium]